MLQTRLFAKHLPSLLITAAAAMSAAIVPVYAAGEPAIPGKACSSEPVNASGEPASYEWLARIKAHSNWRAKVRVLPNLGDPYANWKNAESTTERCISGPEGTVCQFTGIPCRRN